MKLTQFYLKSENKNNEVVLYNTMNEAVLILNNDIVKLIEKDVNILNKDKFFKIKNILIENEFLIDDNIDEEKKLYGGLVKAT